MSFNSVAEFTKAHTLTTAERLLIKHVQSGTPCILNNGALPPEGDPEDDVEIRAPLLRLLIIGGTAECGLHPSGVILVGAHITENLDLRFTKTRGQCTLDACLFDETPSFAQTKLTQLSLERSKLPGIFAQGINVRGDLFLRNLIAEGTVDLMGAEIGGQLECEGARLTGVENIAFLAQSANIGASIRFSSVIAKGLIDISGARVKAQLDCTGAEIDGGIDQNGYQLRSLQAQRFSSGESVHLNRLRTTGTVSFNGAKIGGQLNLSSAILDGGLGKFSKRLRALNAQGAKIVDDLVLFEASAVGTVDLNAAEIGGQLNFQGSTFDGSSSITLDDQAEPAISQQGIALMCQRLSVGHGFFLNHVTSIKGLIHLEGAKIGDLVDDPEGISVANIFIDGFVYDRIGGRSPKSFSARKDWLYRGSRLDVTFSPQPYTQFAKVLREMGHASEARKVIMERERILFDEAWNSDLKLFTAAITTPADKGDSGQIWLRMWCRRLWAGLASRTVGYGHAPERALFWSLGLILFGTVLYFIAYHSGLMVPNSDVIMVSQDWLAEYAKNAAATNAASPTLEWVKNAPSAQHYETFYSLYYATDVFLPLVDFGQESTWAATTTTNAGKTLRFFTFAYQIAGWVITALGIAAITGFVQKGTPD
jgi:hypothetical protein